jgi:hypothetical protein
MHRLARLAVVFLAVVQSGLASPAERARPMFTKPEQVLKWINDYRQHPEPGLVPDMVRALGDLGLLRDFDQAGIYIGFTAGVLGSNSAKAERLAVEMFPLPPEDQPLVIKAIVYSGLPEWKDVLSAVIERMPARKVMIDRYLYGEGKMLDELGPDEGAFALDVNWGYYFATGSQIPIRRIVTTLALASDRNDVEKLTIGSMAKWTLATNASRDLSLLNILKREINHQDEKIRRELGEVILAAETFETGRIRKEAMAAIDALKAKGPEDSRRFAWWGQAGQTALALGCVAASVTGHVEAGIPCVVGGAVSTAALKLFSPQP